MAGADVGREPAARRQAVAQLERHEIRRPRPPKDRLQLRRRGPRDRVQRSLRQAHHREPGPRQHAEGRGSPGREGQGVLAPRHEAIRSGGRVCRRGISGRFRCSPPPQGAGHRPPQPQGLSSLRRRAEGHRRHGAAGRSRARQSSDEPARFRARVEQGRVRDRGRGPSAQVRASEPTAAALRAAPVRADDRRPGTRI